MITPHTPISFTINVGGQLMDLSHPKVMGILNVTPDSFYAESRKATQEAVEQRVEQLLTEGADIIDIGAYSSRPGADDVSTDEELARLRMGMDVIHRMAPNAIVSVDTFRANVARVCVEEMGVHIINDISGGELDKNMFRTVAELGVPYILMHMQGTPQTMQQAPHYDNLMADMLRYFAERIVPLQEMGVKDIIIDPGFGFAKTLEHNYELLHHLSDLHALELPLLVGVSRKSMIYRLLGTTPAEALNGTTALHTIALMQGASILRVHDVKECREVVNIVNKTHSC